MRESMHIHGDPESVISLVVLQIVPGGDDGNSESILELLPGDELLNCRTVQFKRLDTPSLFEQDTEDTTDVAEMEEDREGHRGNEVNEVDGEAEDDADDVEVDGGEIGGGGGGGNLNVCVWQMEDIANPKSKGRRLDSSLFFPHLDAFLIFYDVKEPNVLREWLAVGTQDPRLRDLSPIIIGTHKKGESTKHFERIFEGKKGVFLWQKGDIETLYEIYREILELVMF